jgi:hypothetical protein
MVASGLAKLLFTKVQRGASNCFSAGDEPSTVLVDDAEWKAVPLLPSGWGIAIRLTKVLEVKCGLEKLKIQGTQLNKSLTGLDIEVLTTGAFEVETGKGAGKTPAFSEFDNDAGKMTKVKLEVTLGLAFEETFLEIEGAIKLVPSKMMEVM